MKIKKKEKETFKILPFVCVVTIGGLSKLWWTKNNINKIIKTKDKITNKTKTNERKK